MSNIRDLLYDEWKLRGARARTRIDFNTGVPAEDRKYPSIEVVPRSELSIRIATSYWRNDPQLTIHIWVRPRGESGRSLGNAKKYRRAVWREVIRILHRNQNAVDGIQALIPGNTIHPDEYTANEALRFEQGTLPASKGNFALLHTIIFLSGVTYHHRTAGGIA